MSVGTGSLKRAAKTASQKETEPKIISGPNEAAMVEKKPVSNTAASKKSNTKRKTTSSRQTVSQSKKISDKVKIENHMGNVIYQINDELPEYLL